MRKLVMAVTIVGAALLASASAHADTKCANPQFNIDPTTGNPFADGFNHMTSGAGESFDKVVVEQVNCKIDGPTIVDGDVEVKGNATLIIDGRVSPVLIRGKVRGSKCFGVILRGAVAVKGDVIVENCGDRTRPTDTSGYIGPEVVVGGHFRCKNNFAHCNVIRGWVDGNVEIENNISFSGSIIVESVVFGNVTVKDNLTERIFSDECPGGVCERRAAIIAHNRLLGNLKCEGNDLNPIDSVAAIASALVPPLLGGPSIIALNASGQCAGLKQ